METEQRKSPWKLRYRQPAAVWEEALPLGNGHMGGYGIRRYRQRADLAE
ncbi:glycoside hydrolase N-terminal domain-containing protein [Paenibacillus rhizoplanae]